MPAYCIVPELAEKLKKAVQSGDVIGDIGKLYEMSSEERRAAFSKFVDKDNAREINAGFEKAMISNQKKALNNWVEGTFNPQAIKEKRAKSAMDAIEELDTLLTPENEKEFLEDLVAQKLGIHLTAEEGAKISKMAADIETAKGTFKRLGDASDNPNGQIDYLKKKRVVENYLKAKVPSGKVAILTSTIGRGNLLLRFSSMILNIVGNTFQGGLAAVERRLETRRFQGMSTDLAMKTQRFYVKVFQKTGYDLTRTTTLDLPKSILGEEQFTHSQGKGVIRAIGRFYEDKVFGLTQGLPDVFSSSIAHVDRANIEASKLAKMAGLKGKAAKDKANEILKDALLLEPETDLGKAVREAAIEDAAYSTLQHKTIFSEKAMAFRRILNVGDLKFGDMQIPFIKTPANAIAVAIADRSGVMIPVKAVTNTIQAVKLIQGEQSMLQLLKSRRPDMETKKAIQLAFKGYTKTIVRGGLGTTTAFLLANALNPDNFIGEYPTDPREAKLLELGNATPNSIKVGDHWVSTDYLTALAAPFVGFMYAKKYGNTPEKYIESYLRGLGYQVTTVPGISEVRDLVRGLYKLLPSDKMKDPKDTALNELYHYAAQFITSRSIPGLISQIATATDKKRDTSRKNDNLADVKGQIPWLRQTLPEKRNIFGEEMETEGWSTLLFGSRVKTAKEDEPVIDELFRLNSTGNIPSLTDVTKTSSRAKQLKEQIGEMEYEQFFVEFGQAWKEGIGELIQDDDYLTASDEEKANMINDTKKTVFNEFLEEYGYEKPEKE